MVKASKNKSKAQGGSAAPAASKIPNFGAWYVRANYKDEWRKLIPGSEKMSVEDVINSLTSMVRYGKLTEKDFV